MKNSFVVLLILLLSVTSRSQESLSDPLNLISARAAGMGKALTALVDDATAIYWNPAALSRLENGQLGLMLRYANRFFSVDDPLPSAVSAWDIDAASLKDVNFFALAFPFSGGNDNTHLGFAVRKYRFFPELLSESVVLRDTQKNIWKFKNDGIIYVFSAAASVDLTATVSLGGAAHFYSGTEKLSFQESVADQQQLLYQNTQRFSRTSFSIGLSYNYNSDWTFGLNASLPHNLDRKQEYHDEGGLLTRETELLFPLFFNLGAAYKINSRLDVAADLIYKPWQKVLVDDGIRRYPISDFSLNTIHLGAEYLLKMPPSPIYLRLGYYYNPTVYQTSDGAQITHHVITTGAGWYSGELKLNLGIEWIPSHYRTSRLNLFQSAMNIDLPESTFSSHTIQFTIDFLLRIT